MKVSVNILKSSSLAHQLCTSMAKGINASGDKAVIRSENDKNVDGFGAAVLYGYVTPCQEVIAACKAAGIPWVFFDLGYWKRDNYYKVAVNDRHPTKYLMARDMPDDRLRCFIPSDAPHPWRQSNPGQSVVVAGMSGKAAWSWGMDAESFERGIIAKLSKLTRRPIIYRAKPSFAGAKKIAGATFSHHEPIGDVLKRAHCVVTYHSNVGVDALIAGVPVFADHGAASLLALVTDSIEGQLESPWLPDNRAQWAANLAYCQWSPAEMANGSCWKHIRSVMEYA